MKIQNTIKSWVICAHSVLVFINENLNITTSSIKSNIKWKTNIMPRKWKIQIPNFQEKNAFWFKTIAVASCFYKNGLFFVANAFGFRAEMTMKIILNPLMNWYQFAA